MAETKFLLTGMNNVLDPADVGEPDPKAKILTYTEVVLLQNVDMDNAASVSLRSGRVAVANGAGYHSGWSNPYNPDEAYFVRDGGLWRMTVDTDLIPAFTLIRAGLSDDRMCFTQVNDVVWYSNGTVWGIIEDGVDVAPRAPAGNFKATMIPGQFAEFYNGRVYVLVNGYGDIPGSALVCSESMNAETIDQRLHVAATFDGLGKGICRVDDGLFVSAGDETFFLKGADISQENVRSGAVNQGFEFNSVAPYSMLPGTIRPIKAEHLGIKGLSGWACIWASTRGVCVGGAGGYFANITEEKVSYPTGSSGTAVVREQRGVVHYIFVIDGAGEAFNVFVPREVDPEIAEGS